MSTTQSQKRTSSPTPPETTTSLNCNDVIFGRGSGPNEFSGNVNFRKILSIHRNDYLATNNRAEKGKISRSIVDCIHSLHPPGRFLVKEKDTWVVVVHEKAQEKVKQALRQIHHRGLEGGRNMKSAEEGGVEGESKLEPKHKPKKIEEKTMIPPVESKNTIIDKGNYPDSHSSPTQKTHKHVSSINADIPTVPIYDYQQLHHIDYLECEEEKVRGKLVVKEASFRLLDEKKVNCDQKLHLPTDDIISEPAPTKKISKIDDDIYDMSVSMSSLLSNFDLEPPSSVRASDWNGLIQALKDKESSTQDVNNLIQGLANEYEMSSTNFNEMLHVLTESSSEMSIPLPTSETETDIELRTCAEIDEGSIDFDMSLDFLKALAKV